jgi:Ser/Thr protein kinase RdoA (MazF antagonist)
LPLGADRYVRKPVEWLAGQNLMPPSLEARYCRAALAIADVYEEQSRGVATHRIHGDLYLGNILFRDEILWLLDFDDMATGPAIQDLWLAFPGRDSHSLSQRERLLEAYSQLRELDANTLNLVEPLRGLRMVRYDCWVARRWHDPAFQRGWPHFGTDEYWHDATEDLESQLDVVWQEGGPSREMEGGSGQVLKGEKEDPSELSNKDYFWDWED